MVVQDLVEWIIWHGDKAELAMDKIYDAYGGQTSVTSNLVNGLKRDKHYDMGLSGAYYTNETKLWSFEVSSTHNPFQIGLMFNFSVDLSLCYTRKQKI